MHIVKKDLEEIIFSWYSIKSMLRRHTVELEFLLVIFGEFNII